MKSQVGFSEGADIADTYKEEKKDLDFLTKLTEEQARGVLHSENIDKMYEFKRGRIKKELEVIEEFYREKKSQFTEEDVDLIDKAERYHFNKTAKNDQKKLRDVDTETDEVKSFIKPLSKAITNGCLDKYFQAEAEKETITQSPEKEKPFWRRNYKVGNFEFKLKINDIERQIVGADHAITDDPTTFYRFKKRALFSKGDVTEILAKYDSQGEKPIKKNRS